MWKPRGSTQRHTERNTVQRRWQDPLPVRHRLRPGRPLAPHLCDQRGRRVSVGLPCANLQRWGCVITEYELLIILTAGGDCCCQRLLPAVQRDCRVSWRIHHDMDPLRHLQSASDSFVLTSLSFDFHELFEVDCFDVIDSLMVCDLGDLVCATDVVKSGTSLH